MNRVLVVAGTVATLGLAIMAIVHRPDAQSKPWKTTDVWYHESDVARLNRTARPLLVEFFHPD